MKFICDALHVGRTFHPLSLGCVVMIEVLARRLASIVDALSVAGVPSWENARYYQEQPALTTPAGRLLKKIVVRGVRDECEVESR